MLTNNRGFNPVYLYSRRFIELFPNFVKFLENIDPYLTVYDNINEEDSLKIKDKIYKRLKLKYASSFFRYSRAGTCIDVTVEFVNNVFPYFIRNLFLENIEKNNLSSLSNYSESTNFATDNTTSNNIEGFETDKNISKMTSYSDMNKLSKDLYNLRQNIEKIFKSYGKNFLQNIQERRED